MPSLLPDSTWAALEGQPTVALFAQYTCPHPAIALPSHTQVQRTSSNMDMAAAPAHRLTLPGNLPSVVQDGRGGASFTSGTGPARSRLLAASTSGIAGPGWDQPPPQQQQQEGGEGDLALPAG